MNFGGTQTSRSLTTTQLVTKTMNGQKTHKIYIWSKSWLIPLACRVPWLSAWFDLIAWLAGTGLRGNVRRQLRGSPRGTKCGSSRELGYKTVRTPTAKDCLGNVIICNPILSYIILYCLSPHFLAGGKPDWHRIPLFESYELRCDSPNSLMELCLEGFLLNVWEML